MKRPLLLIPAFLLFTFLAGCPAKQDSLQSLDSLKTPGTSTQTRVDSANQDAGSSRQNAITRAAAKAGPAVVGINVIQVKKYVRRSPFYTEDPFWRNLFPEYFKDKVYKQRVQSLGSGFLISKDGFLLTNEHVVQDAEEIVVTLPGGERHNAQIIGTDEISDVALLKIDGNIFPYLELGNSQNAIVGEWVIALGNPFGLFELNDQPTVTVGVISALNRDWGRVSDGRVYMDMIQTDAAINHGNSGGPLVNALGEAIGMNTFIYTGSRSDEGFVGIGFAIPVNRIRNIIQQIRKYGQVNRDYWLGFRVQDLNAYLIRALELNVDHGVIVAQVDEGSSAAAAGLLPEDIILKLNDRDVQDTNGLTNMLANMDLQVGDILYFEILRNNKLKKIRFELLKRESPK